MLKRLGYLALLVYGLSLLGAAIAPRPRTPDAQPADKTSHVATAPAETQPVIGFALNLHHTDKLHLYLQAVDELADAGFTAVEVLTPAFQANGASEEIRIESGPGRGPSRQQLLTLLQHARARGLRTSLMPVVLLSEPRGNEWRGKIQPEKWDPWWKSYRRMTDYFLEVANEADVSIYTVGSELLSTEGQTDRWEELIRYVRSRFSGRLTYSTNWDHYHKTTFWKQVDFIGINGYWNITTLAKADKPDLPPLVQRWQQIRKQVLDFAADQGRPVLLTEIGYPSLPWALRDPWNYIAGGKTSDPDAQLRGYSAFLAVWGDLLRGEAGNSRAAAPLAGVFFYEWDVYYSGGPQDTGYGVRGKPAYERLKQWLRQRQPGSAGR